MGGPGFAIIGRSDDLYIAPACFCLVPFPGSLERKPDLRYIVILHHESESMSRIEDAGARPDNPLHCITPRFTASCQSTDSAVLVDQHSTTWVVYLLHLRDTGQFA